MTVAPPSLSPAPKVGHAVFVAGPAHLRGNGSGRCEGVRVRGVRVRGAR